MEGSFVLQLLAFVLALVGIYEPAYIAVAAVALAILQLGTAACTAYLLATKQLTLHRTFRTMWLSYCIGVLLYFIGLGVFENFVFVFAGPLLLTVLAFVNTGFTAFKPQGFHRRGSFLPNIEF